MSKRPHANLFGPSGLARTSVGPFLAWCALLAFHWLLFAPPTYAYIDPGTGSYLVQVVIAGLLGVLFSLKIYWGRIKVFFKDLLKFGRKDPAKHE